MKRPLASVAAITIVLLMASISFSKTPAPDFLSWGHCFGQTSGMIWRITCFDKEPMVIADNMIVWYSESDREEGALLMWFVLERSKDVFSTSKGAKSYRVDKHTIHFYKNQRNQDNQLEWVWLETKELIWTSSNEDRKLDIVDVNSPFGKEYVSFMKRMGRDPASVNMPSIKFYK